MGLSFFRDKMGQIGRVVKKSNTTVRKTVIRGCDSRLGLNG
ncbi:MAG: hypothetical protein UX99_C0002G0014 [Candidatus Amesbacteria bacterium GW2011_GWB1_47_26]|uniref:Uncharacterized protein n=1 Tax=Candidatus Amesbacteria bacterium GW2011_GWC2_45_19 TaxID=1618366 RepID=A0A0G1PAY8_9BACT|nr:MAG: hypothetical protein UX05_C0011G0014 [Candidatus Amesbacteria bacterium GW2011_GWC2_45_19]KKU37862.1 MAG: hypothetical protein UX52_C0016G0013 [Candidatus Amesbacteria bacterium GW2011_GWA1_46_35]KKU69323.1 MAG: hypothetical protein UX93_C0002G0162 [Microgenomates group bacterium GW2011_GWC1_47_20]KKU75043.1 MAG: hypothetical protein UX99_C0002G0014 [Candidatus Amesbacteria bacterium GW2011_GWB1_47_26]